VNITEVKKLQDSIEPGSDFLKLVEQMRNGMSKHVIEQLDYQNMTNFIVKLIMN
jgi:hypothetical protein